MYIQNVHLPSISMGGGKGKNALMQSEQLFLKTKEKPETDQLRIKSTASFAKSH